MSMIHHLGVSGGKDSTALLLWAVYESGLPRESLNVTFADTGNESQITLDYVAMLSEKVHRIVTLKPERDFYELAKHKQRFPSPRARFCTTELKMKPSRDHVWKIRDAGNKVTLLTGVRAAESRERASLPEREIADWYYGLPVWRPLLKWTIDDVWAIHKRHGIEPNPLYGMGMTRVGCFPCIMSKKSAIAAIASLWPEQIVRLAEREEKTLPAPRFAGFFGRKKVPTRYHSRDWSNPADGSSGTCPTAYDVARWALDGAEIDKARAVQEGRQLKMEFDTSADDAPVCSSTYGACE